MKTLHFLKWLFDWTRWESYTKRYVIFTVIGIVFGLFTEMHWGAFLVAGLIWLDVFATIFKDKYNEFNNEQKQLLNDIKGDSKYFYNE